LHHQPIVMELGCVSDLLLNIPPPHLSLCWYVIVVGGYT
jgi:hypothetical protein